MFGIKVRDIMSGNEEKEMPTREFKIQRCYFDEKQDAGAMDILFSPSQNKFWLYTNPNEDIDFENFSLKMVHEQKHQDNHMQEISNMPMSLEQYYKNCMHNEISADMAMLLAMREKYVNATTDDERMQLVNSGEGQRFSFYFSAIQQGKINPFSKNSADFKKEMQFIAQETQQRWVANSYEFYHNNQLVTQTREYFNSHNYEEMVPNEENYEKAKKIAYGTNLGGIDFTPYIKDIDIPIFAIKEADKIIHKDGKREDVLKLLDSKKELQSYCNFEQTAVVKKAQTIGNCLKDNNIISFRNLWIKQFYDNPDRKEIQETVQGIKEGKIRAVCDNKTVQAYINAVVAGDIQPNPLGMDKKEEDFIAQLFAKESENACTLSVDECDKQWQQYPKDISAEDSQKVCDFLVKQNLTYQGINLGKSFNPKCDQTLVRMDEKVKVNAGLSNNFEESFAEYMPALKVNEDAEQKSIMPMSPLKFWAEQPKEQNQFKNLWENVKSSVFSYNKEKLQEINLSASVADVINRQPTEKYVYCMEEPKFNDKYETISIDICDLRVPFLEKRYQEMQYAERETSFNAKVNQACAKTVAEQQVDKADENTIQNKSVNKFSALNLFAQKQKE